MDIKLTPIDQTKTVLDAISKKQEIIACNIANANTPGYLKKDASFSQLLNAGGPLDTDLSKRIGPNPFIMEENGEVDVKQELIKMQKNSMYYAVAARRMSSVITQMKTVTNVGS